MMTRARPMAIRRSRVQTRNSWRSKLLWEGLFVSEGVRGGLLAGMDTADASEGAPAGAETLFSSGFSISCCLLFIPCGPEIALAVNCTPRLHTMPCLLGFEPTPSCCLALDFVRLGTNVARFTFGRLGRLDVRTGVIRATGRNLWLPVRR